jgi:predicted nuclease of restriction endonuclease-like (RecB) superfamily
MKIKKDNSEISIEDRLHVELSGIIKNKHGNLVRVANAELVALFWQIGKELNECLDKTKQTKDSKLVIRSISSALVENYGHLLNEKKIKEMGLFANLFPDLSAVKQFVHFVSWEHILVLLKIKDWDARQFYLRLKMELGLSVKDLRRQISSGLYERQQSDKTPKLKDGYRAERTPKNDAGLLQIPKPDFEMVTKNDLVLTNVFKEPLLSSFRMLTEPAKGLPKQLVVKNKKPSGIEEELFEAITQHIKEYRHRQNNWLKNHLNLLFWEIGKRINQEILQNGGSISRESMIQNISVSLEKKFGKNFTGKQLNAMTSFAEQFTDLGLTLRMAYPVSWEHILTLLSLQEVEAKLFYARLTAIKGLSAAGLQKQIAKKTYEQTPGAKELEQTTLLALQNPTTQTTTKKKGNSVVSITTIDYEFDDVNNISPVINIFKNSYFLNLLSAF